MPKGHVYIMTNPAMPGVCKIGRTCGDPDARARQLDNTSAPMPFEVWDSVLSPDCAELESFVHEALNANRVRAGREFFAVCKIEASSIVRGLHEEQVVLWMEEFLPAHVVMPCSDQLNLMKRAAR